MKLLNKEALFDALYGGNTMKITLLNTYTNRERRLAEIERQIEELDEKLKTPERTLDDIIRHIELLKERNSYLNN